MNPCFEPALWPEDRSSGEAESYRQCEVCSQGSGVIWGEGNPEAPILIILDNPGARQDKNGKDYVCPTRQTLQTALDQAGLPAEDIYLTYLLKCRPLRSYDKEKARAFSRPFLIRQIQKMRPRLIIGLGDVVAQAMFNNKEACVKNLRGAWNEVLGYPFMVSYHPLAVRRRPNLRGKFMEDLGMAAKKMD